MYGTQLTCKWGTIWRIKGFEANTASSSDLKVYSEVIKRAIHSSFATDKELTRSFFVVFLWRAFNLESLIKVYYVI